MQRRDPRGGVWLQATPKLLATLIAAGIAFLLVKWLGRELEEAEKELINTTAPLIAGLLTGYWWDDNWGLQEALPKLPLVVAGIVSALLYFILDWFGYTLNVFNLEVIKALGPVIVGLAVWFIFPIPNRGSPKFLYRPNGPAQDR